MLHRVFAVLVSILVTAGCVTAAQRNDGAGTLRKVAGGPTWSMPKRLGADGVLAIAYVDTPRTRLAVARERGHGAAERVLAFYVRRGKAFVETHRFTTTYSFIAMRASETGDRLFTTWASGKGVSTVVFGVDGSDVRVALSLSQEPEFVDVDGDGESEIVEAVESPGSHAPSGARVYRWNGKEYTLLRTVPWTERLMLVR
jgi:hypothetical protein